MGLKKQLEKYTETDAYPFHMPGHKRQMKGTGLPYEIDITEIEGFDDLHQAEGILKEEMEKAAAVYGAEQSYFLVNGSTAGNLASIFAAIPDGGKLLVARNCHRSVYHGAMLRRAKVTYLYPEITESGICGSIMPEKVEETFQREPDLQAFVMTSPTYEGVISNIKAIADIVHRYHAILIVDEAHGAHLGFDDSFPMGSLSQGADLVIHSLHKTLPCLTQTGLLHCNGDLQLQEKVHFFLKVFQTSSPSYVFMSSMSDCIGMLERKELQWKNYSKQLGAFAKAAEGWGDNLQLWRPEERAVFGYDPSKLVLISSNGAYHGNEIMAFMRESYHLELEMATSTYALAMTSVMDSEGGLKRLAEAAGELSRLDHISGGCKQEWQDEAAGVFHQKTKKAREIPPEIVCDFMSAREGEREALDLDQALGKVAAEFVYQYPPGIPILAPGERIRETDVAGIREAWQLGLKLQGLVGTDEKQVLVIKQEAVKR